MVAVKKQTQSYYDYSDLAEAVEANLGKDLRDYAGMFNDGHHEDRPYQDFWHWWLETDDMISNGHMQECVNIAEWIEMAKDDGEEDWVIEILQEFANVLGEDADKDISVKHYW